MYNFDEPAIEYIKRYLSYDNSLYDTPRSSIIENKKSMLATSVNADFIDIINWNYIDEDTIFFVI